MKLAVITPGYAPDVGGLERHVTELTRSLAALGVDIEVWAQARRQAGTTTEISHGIVVRRLPATRSVRFSMSPALWMHARRYGGSMDLVHAHGYHSTAALAALASNTRTPCVVTPHYHGTGHTRLATALHGPYRLAGQRLLARSRRVIAVSSAERALLEAKFPVVRGRCSVIHNAVGGAAGEGVEPFPDQPATLLVLGRLERYKRVDLVMQGFDAATMPGQLIVIGEGADHARLNHMRSGLRRRSDIHLLGKLPDADVLRWLATCQAVVSMSEHEAFGIVALEAVAAGASALLSDIPAHREVQQMATGRVRLTAAAGPDALAGELARAVTQARGEPVAVRTWEQAAAEHLDLYRDVLGVGCGS